MFSNFQKAFNPTPEQKRAMYDKINATISNDLKRHGQNCRNCKYAEYVQEYSYHDYLKCKLSWKVIEPYETCVCDQYNFCGWL